MTQDNFWTGVFCGAVASFFIFTETGKSLLGLGAKATQKGIKKIEKKYNL